MSMFRRSVSKAGKNTNSNVQPLPTYSALPPQPSQSPDPRAPTEETFEDRLKVGGDGPTAARDCRRKLAFEDEAINSLVQDLDEYVVQLSTVRSKLEGDASRNSKPGERFEYETFEVDALRSMRGERVSCIYNVVASRGTKPESCKPEEPQPGAQ
jgi:hypothetical protein